MRFSKFAEAMKFSFSGRRPVNFMYGEVLCFADLFVRLKFSIQEAFGLQKNNLWEINSHVSSTFFIIKNIT